MSAMRKLPDPQPIFERYEILAREADAVFSRVKSDYPECVSCREGCNDCCHALFDLTLVEAAYLNAAFLAAFPVGAARSAAMEKAYEADRLVHRIKRKAFKAQQAGEKVETILAELAKQRVRCPLLGEDDRCVLYEHRPVTCRLYGIPTAIGGKGRVCGKSAFSPGAAYPTANIDRMHDKLVAVSKDLALHMGSGFSEIHTVLAPISMALTTAYDAAYYGVREKTEKSNER